MRWFAAILPSLLFLLACQRAQPNLPAEIELMSSHLSYPDEYNEGSTTATTYNVDLGFSEALELIGPRLSEAGWIALEPIASKNGAATQIYDNLPESTIAVSRQPNPLFRENDRTAVTFTIITRQPPYKPEILAREKREEAGIRKFEEEEPKNEAASIDVSIFNAAKK